MPRKYTKIHRKKRGLRKTKHRRNKRGGSMFSIFNSEPQEETKHTIEELNLLILKDFYKFAFKYYKEHKNDNTNDGNKKFDFNDIFDKYNPSSKYRILLSDYKLLYINKKNNLSIYIGNNRTTIKNEILSDSTLKEEIKQTIMEKEQNNTLSAEDINKKMDDIFESIHNVIYKNYNKIIFKYFTCLDSNKREVNCLGRQ